MILQTFGTLCNKRKPSLFAEAIYATQSVVLIITSVNIYHSAISSQRSDQSDHDTS